MSDREELIETMARAIFDRRNKGMKNVWAWDDSGLDDEHPYVRENVIRDATAALTAIEAAGMRMNAGWQPIETAPQEGEFLAERQTTGDWLKVVRYSGLKGVSSEVNVVHLRSGLLWPPDRWMPLPTQPAQEDSTSE